MSVVKPTIFSHHKFVLLKTAMGEVCIYHLLRLWCHCEGNQRGERWPGATPAYVEAVADWKGKAGKLYNVLRSTGWLEEQTGCVVIHGWAENNARIVSNWHMTKERLDHHKGKPTSQPRLKPTSQPARHTGQHQGANPSANLSTDLPDLPDPSVHLSSTTKGNRGYGGKDSASPRSGVRPKVNEREIRAQRAHERGRAVALSQQIQKLEQEQKELEEGEHLPEIKIRELRNMRAELDQLQKKQIHDKA